MPPATSNPTIYIFEKHYRPNSQGKVFVGVNMETLAGKYAATFYVNGIRQCCDYEEVEVLQTTFEKTRISSYTGKPNSRTDRQKQKIDEAFRTYNEIDKSIDYTGGLGYIDPLPITRDVIDPFGLIYENNPFRRHEGVDLRTSTGNEVRAINAGRAVLVVKGFRAEGNMIIISHGLGIFSVYMHLSKFKVKEGEIVKQKQIIALSGKTGRGVREPHLHFNIKIIDTYVDPLKFIDTINQYLF
jgi:murein DD-endopeptidase MepM/ murein hydrolase activator NlpD